MRDYTYFETLGFAASVALNAITGGKRGETFSSRCYRCDFTILERVLDRFLSEGHCRRSYWRWTAAEHARWSSVVPPREGGR